MKMIVGLASIEKGVKENLLAMKQHGGATNPAHEMTTKLHTLLAKMTAKVNAELADPARKDDPLVAIDVKMLDTMKKAVKKSEALILVGAIAMKKAKSDEERTKIKASVKGAMSKVMGQLKTDIQTLKEEAVAVGTAQMQKQQEAKPDEEPAKDDGADEKQASDAELKGLLDKIAGIGAAKEAAHLRSH